MLTVESRKNLITVLAVFAVAAFGIIFARAFYYYPSGEVALPEELAAQFIIDDLPGEPDLPQSEDPENNPLTASPAASDQAASSSMRLSIPKIKVNAKVQEVGVTKKGAMAAPSIFSEVGWYKYGTLPGRTGSAVMAGHVDNGVAFPAVFKRLPELKVGDDVYVDMKDGTRLHFKVTGKKTYPYDSAPEEVFLDKSGKLLKLITCTGKIIRELRTHSQRLVVTAELVE